MKKTVWLTFIFVLICVFSLSSCENGSSSAPEVCQHNFSDWKTTIQPTCKAEGKRVRTCNICYKNEEESIQKSKIHTPVIDEEVPATCANIGLTEGSHCSVCNTVIVNRKTIAKLSHSYENRRCVNCNDWQGSEGLEFVSNSTGYALSGVGTCKDELLIIPSTYNGRPVTEIASNALNFPSSDYYPHTVIIPDSIKNVRHYALAFKKFIKLIIGENAAFEEQSIRASGGCEIMYSSSRAIPTNAIDYHDEFAPYVIRKSTESSCVTTEDGFVFIKDGEKYYLCDYVGTLQDIVLPDLYDESEYIIASRCFYKNTVISSVQIGNGVTGIGQSAFAYSSIKTVNLNGQITELPSFCFTGCQNLESVVIPDNITAIQNQCFEECGLNSVTIGKNVTTINVFAFNSCSKLDTLYFNAENCTEIKSLALQGFKNLVIGSSVQKIPSKFMKGNTYLKSITFEENSSCESIGTEAFDKASITEITLPRMLTHIGEAFEDCTELERINILCENLQYGADAFYDCGSNGDGIVINVGSDVTVLPSNFLNRCKIKTLIFDSGSKCKIIQASFSNSKISNVTLPASIENFDKSIFDLKTLSLEEGSENYTLKNSCLISLKDSRLIAVLDEGYIIPENVTIIAKGAFYESGVKHIYIPDTVLTMEYGSLCCSSVESVSLPFIGTDRNTPTKLLELFGSDVQYGWIQVDLNAGFTTHERYYVPSKFSKLTVRDTSISTGLVGLSMLKEIEISETVGTITQAAFKDCKNLTDIYFGGSQEQWDNLKTSGWLTYVSMNVNLVLNAEIDT